MTVVGALALLILLTASGWSVQAMITLANQLGIKVIAEGVETPQQSETLAGLQCEQAQGYLFSQPLSVEDVEKLLDAEMKG